MHRAGWLLIGLLLSAGLRTPPAAKGLVNPNYTVVELVGDAERVLTLRMSRPKDGQISTELVEALKGKRAADEAPRFAFRTDGAAALALAAAFGESKTATGVLFVRKDPDGGKRSGSLHVGTTWLDAVGQGKNAWKLYPAEGGEQTGPLETVWNGSARQLVRAARYARAHPRAEFPVSSGLTWSGAKLLGVLDGPARGCLVTTAGVIVLCDAGDRAYRPGDQDAGPSDVTDRLALRSRSRALAAGDFNADGRVDFASWDGKRVRLVLRKPDGTFATPTGGAPLDACTSLGSLGGVVVAAGPAGVRLFKPDANGDLSPEPLAEPASRKALAAAGPAVLADFNDDGRPDILQIFEKGLVFHAAGPTGFAAPKTRKLELPKGPAAAGCGDYDTDGRLDVMVAGVGGAALLSRDADGQWRTVTDETGEFVVAVGSGRTEASFNGASAADLNGDGLQSVALFSADGPPGLFFNRGFNSFAVARSLDPAEPFGAYDALSAGQLAGTVCDLNGDLAADLLGVDRARKVRARLTEPGRRRRFALRLTAPPAAGPMTVTVSLGKRALGIYVLRPGEPTTIALPGAGRARLDWKTPEGAEVSRHVVVVRPTDIGVLEAKP